LVMSLYPATQKKPALAANVVKLLDAAISTAVAENTQLPNQDYIEERRS